MRKSFCVLQKSFCPKGGSRSVVRKVVRLSRQCHTAPMGKSLSSHDCVFLDCVFLDWVFLDCVLLDWCIVRLVYCSIGVRSENIGEKLQQLGYTNVYNLYGGIFEYKNEGGTVYNLQNKPTDSVHTYNKKWSKYLTKGNKVYE